MEEKVLKNKKNGMTVLLLTIFLELAAIAGIVVGIAIYETTDMKNLGTAMGVVGGIVTLVGWIPFCGLKVLRPQEAIVLTLFGEYVGTIKEPGFYFVNPFCTAVNPAANTKLAQSGDATTHGALTVSSSEVQTTVALPEGKKISLKSMTLSNGKQKINDCLGNPIEIAIAVIWKVTDTGKAVFNVDNYKEYLSLQCDSALRDRKSVV